MAVEVFWKHRSDEEVSAERDAVKEASRERGRGVGRSKTEAGKKCRRSTREALEEHLWSVEGASEQESRWRNAGEACRAGCEGNVWGACWAGRRDNVKEASEERRRSVAG